jgi:hypothetical protein
MGQNGNNNNNVGFERLDSFGGGDYASGQNQGGQATMMGDYMGDAHGSNGQGGNANGLGGGSMTFDFGQNGVGFGGEMLAGEGMDTVSDGLRGGDQNQGL